MKFRIKLLSLMLAILMLVTALASCGGEGEETTDGGVTETEAVESTPAETNKTETGMQEVVDSETETSAEDQPVDGVLLSLDFNTDLMIYEYFWEIDGVEMNDRLDGGEIIDGRWHYDENPLAFKDDCGIFELASYSVEFDFCFNSFVNKDNTSIFTFITDNDGVLGGDSSFYPLKMDMDGKLYHFNLKAGAVQIEAGKVYHVKYDISRVDKNATIYLNEVLLAAVDYSQPNNEYNCFRFMDVGRGADMWIDNFVVKDLGAMVDQSTQNKLVAIEAAFVRAGSYAKKPQGLADGKYVDIKATEMQDVYREGLIKFDISHLQAGQVKYAKFMAQYVNMSAERTFDIYWVDSDWDSETVTYKKVPSGKLIADNINLGGVGAPLELSAYIEEAIAKGDKTFSIKIVPVYQEGEGQTRIYFTAESKPCIMIFDESPENGYFTKLVSNEEENDKIWKWAQKMYDEWYAKYQALPAVNENAEMLQPDPAQYIRTSYASSYSENYAATKKAYKTRPLEAITDLDSYVSDEVKNAELDAYGGLMAESLKQKATGFFYTAKIDGRWWIIDPLGYPYVNVGLSQIDYSLNGSQLQKENALKKYGTFENWAKETTLQVRDQLYFNSSFSPRAEMIAVKDGLTYMAHISVMASYGSIKGVRTNGNGSTVFTENNTMPVFDPDFVGFANNYVKEKLAANANDPRIIGYTSDNELPMDIGMLDNSLAVNHTNPANVYTYACAWTWLVNITGKEAPTHEDITDELRDLYRGFVYDRYFSVVSEAIDAADANHMYMGCRFLTVSKDSQWVYRFAAPYLDCMTINWYFCWEPQSEALYGIERNGDMPFIVTEFYTKAGDSGLPNMSGAGLYVATQADRADYYETFTLKLLESNNCVGWQLFHYMDNDPNSGTSDKSSVDANKGIYNNNYEMYTVFTDRIAVLNKNVYNILDYFKNKK
ncbi:MAG: DNRLRE domain-containing protein [Clostridia bacterium]|nr:DNRLRE domain-containing protein [Clostridia bacterium]